MFYRFLTPSNNSSFFLLGARGTGKSTFLKGFFQAEKTLWLDLLDPNTEERFSQDPSAFTQELKTKQDQISWVILDEIQKIPKLLDQVHWWIENSKLRFALTGSSARKLKRGSANLLAGRAFVNHLFPLTHIELGDVFNLEAALQWGTLPSAVNFTHDGDKADFLRTYGQTYLKEEIRAEQLVRKLDPFRRFLEVAAQTNGDIVNYTNIARDVSVDVKTVQSYYEILSDTLVGFFLEPHHHSIRKQQRTNPKFYFFDTGVKRALDRTLTQALLPNTYAFGRAFEHFFIIEAIRLSDYAKRDFRFSYLRTKDQAEIDLIIERPGASTILAEIKSSDKVDDRATQTLERFLSDYPKAEAFVVSRDPHPKKIGRVFALPWQQALKEWGLLK